MKNKLYERIKDVKAKIQNCTDCDKLLRGELNGYLVIRGDVFQKKVKNES